MTFLGTDGKCDNCGKDLDDVDEPVTNSNHEFCGVDCKEEYQAEHDHEDDGEEEAEVCEFC